MKAIVCKLRDGLALLPLALASALLSPSVPAAPFSEGGVSINIPAGFEGPDIQDDAGAKVFRYWKRSAAANARTLPVITVFERADLSIPAGLTEDQLAQRTERSLLSLLKGVK